MVYRLVYMPYSLNPIYRHVVFADEKVHFPYKKTKKGLREYDIIRGEYDIIIRKYDMPLFLKVEYLFLH
jgi:hypothetical protein